LGAVLLSGKFARRIALSAALGSGAIGSLLVVHGEILRDGNWVADWTPADAVSG
jgi:hypothetical protein